MSATQSSDVVKVQIVLKHDAKHKEVIKRVTRTHEVVEVPDSDFLFRRKRKAQQPAAPAQPSKQQRDGMPQSPPVIALGLQPTGTADVAVVEDQGMTLSPPPLAAAPTGRAADANADGAVGARVGTPPLPSHQQQGGADDATEAAPLCFTLPRTQLTYLVQWLLTNELKKAGVLDPSRLTAVAGSVTKRFTAQLQQQLQGQDLGNGGGGGGSGAQVSRCGAGVGAAALHGLAALPYQVSKLKAALQEKKDKLQQEAAAWVQLQDRYRQLGGELERGAGASDVVPSSPLNSQQEQEQGAGGVAAAAAAGAATAARASALEGMGLQVESLCAMMSKMEQLVASGEAACAALQAEHHAERFSAFPHVDSPEYLIKSIIRPGAAVE